MQKIKIYNNKLMKLLSISLVLTVFTLVSAVAQNVNVSGTVTAKTTGETLPGVSVLVKGTTNGTVTDVNGVYNLSVAGTDILVFSFVGMESIEIPVGSQSKIDVALEDNVTALQEIVVIGYGEQKKSVLTAAISSVEGKDLESFSAGSVDQALQGRMAGVQIIPTSGSPGAGYDVKIRGAGSNSSTSPLYIVDGMRVPNMDFLDPNEIGSVEVLKDAASAAIYGAEGANGVIYISTKKGKSGPGKVNYSFQYGAQDQNSPLKVMNLGQFEEYNAEADLTVKRRGDEQLPSQGTDWKGEMFKTAPLMRHALTFSGGSEKTKYLIGAYYLNQDGILGGDKAKFERYSIRMNLSHQIKDWLKVTNNYTFASYNRTSIQENNEFGGIAQSGILMDPATPVVYENGVPHWITNEYGADQNYKTNADGKYWGMSTLVGGETANPIAKMEQIHGSNTINALIGSTALSLTPIEGLEITSRLGLTVGTSYNHFWQEGWFFNDRDTEDARASDTYSDFFNYQWENFASYTKKINDHNFNALIGTSFFKSTGGYLQGNASTLLNPIPQLAYLDAVPNRIQNTNASGNRNSSTLLSYFGRLTYNYKEKYLFGATLRADGSSLLSKDNRWGYFPSVSGGWIISAEDFYGIDAMNFLKFRASWGKNGSLSSLTNLPTGASLATVSAGFVYVDDAGNFRSGAEPTQLANPTLTWETSIQTDIGLDVGFFNDNLTMSADYFIKDTKDLIVPGSPPGFVGNPAGPVNSGTVRNSGFEIELGYGNRSKELKYDINFNFTKIKNEATEVDPNKEFEAGTNIGVNWTSATAMQEGKPLWFFRGYQTSGIFQNQAQIDTYEESVTGGYDNIQPGDPIINDTNGDGTISSADFVEIGSPHPKFSLGLTATLEYKGFDFRFFGQASVGHDVIMGFNRTDRIQANKPEFFYTDRWTGEGSTNDWFRAGVNNLAYASDLMVFDASYFKIRQIQVGYNVPESLLSKIGFNKARIYVSLDNYFTFTGYKGFDPEIGGSNNANSIGVDRGAYPVPKTLLTGLSIEF